MTPEETLRQFRPEYEGHDREFDVALDALVAERDALAARLAEAERENRHLRQYEDRGDFLVYRSEWDELAACVAQLKDALVVMNARAEGAEAEAEALTGALREIGEISEDRFDRKEGYMSGLAEAEHIARAALAAADRPEGTT